MISWISRDRFGTYSNNALGHMPLNYWIHLDDFKTDTGENSNEGYRRRQRSNKRKIFSFYRALRSHEAYEPSVVNERKEEESGLAKLE